MKKVIIGVLALAIILSVSIVNAANNGIPLQMQMLWNAISDLQNQITNIQLIPGPKGDKGDPGESGPQGSQGEPGLSAPTGAGNIAFILGPTILTTDGVLYEKSPGDGVNWIRLTPNNANYLQPPIPVSDIIHWEVDRLLDENGDVWAVDRTHGLPFFWVNLGHP